MSGTDHGTPIELQGFFPNNGTLTAALERLQNVGFRRGDLSPPKEHPHWGERPETDAKNSLVKDEDSAQLRTLGTGMAGYAGAAAVAGVTIATGGAAALAVAAAAAAGAGSVAAATVAGRTAESSIKTQYNELALEGRLILGVRTANVDEVERATQIMQDAGSIGIVPIYAANEATTAGIASASWTG